MIQYDEAAKTKQENSMLYFLNLFGEQTFCDLMFEYKTLEV